MNTNNKALILSLIKDDLIYRKLTNGLSNIGLDSKDYFLNIGDTVFSLMGFNNSKESDAVYEFYLTLTKQVNSIDIVNNYDEVIKLAEEIYEELGKKLISRRLR